jgi:glycosyltransferase involved in cell wall biosynthesis
MHDLQCLILIFFLNNKKKTKYIWDAHELYEFTEYNQRNILFKFIIFLIIKFSHKKLFKIVTVSNSISNFYKERYLIEKKKLFVIENIPLKSKKFQKEKKNLRLIKKKNLIYIGDINYQRFSPEFLNNLNKIPNDWALYFLSPVNSFFLKYKDKYKHKKNLIFLELKQVNNQINFIKRFDIGLIPSNSNCLNYLYSLPNKFWTCYLSGIPILSFNGQELKKRILSEKIGYILYKNDINSMINVLRKLNISSLNKIKNKQKKKLLLFNSSTYLKKKYLKIFYEKKNFKFKKKITYLVCNFVKNDSRVLKIASSAQKSGYDILIIGFQDQQDKILEENYLGMKLILYPRTVLTQIVNHIMLNESPSKFINETKIWQNLRDQDIIYSHDILGLIIVSYSQRRLAYDNIYTPWIHDCHEYMWGSYLHAKEFLDLKSIKGKKRIYYLKQITEYEKSFLNEPDELITVSPQCAEKIKKSYNINRKFNIIFNCPSRSLIKNYKTVRDSLNLKMNEKIIVWCGSVNQSRGAHVIVESLKYLHNFHFVIISNQKNDYVNKLKELATQNHTSERLHFLNMVPHNCVTSFIRDCNYGVHAALKDNENNLVALPNKFFEYLHAGINIITSDVDAMKDFIKRFE